MIRPLIRIAWLNLRRDRVGLGLTFVLPLVFFSVFALLFGQTGDGRKQQAKPISVLVVDLDQTEASRRLCDSLARQEALKVERATPPSPSREAVQQRVRQGEYSTAVIIPAGWGNTFARFGQKAESVEILYDAANPLARPTVAGLLQAAATSGMMDLLMERGFGWLDDEGGGLTVEQRQKIDALKPVVRKMNDHQEQDSPKNDDANSSSSGLLQLEATPARVDRGQDPKQPKRALVSYYAAGLGVMFLLFSMTGIGGTLLEEEENGTLARLLSSGVPMGTLLTSKWLFHTLVGTVQVAVMFAWGAAAFGLDLWTANHLSGFVVMTALTAASASALGLVLATVCRSSTQLNGISITLTLIMSAVGGSMVPRVFMPKFMDTLGLLTFNGWAIDGYLKVFWYEDPQASIAAAVFRLWPQVTVLALLTAVFLAIARLLARRWEVI